MRNLYPLCGKMLDEVKGSVVVRAEHGGGPLQLCGRSRLEHLLAPQPRVVQRIPERREPRPAPVHHGIGMEKRIRMSHALPQKEVRRLSPDVLRRVADERDVLVPFLQRTGVDVHHDGGDGGFRKRADGVLCVGYGHDEAVRAVRYGRSENVSRQFDPCADKPHVPWRTLPIAFVQVVEYSGKLLLSGDPGHLERNQHFFLFCRHG